ncbi:MAG: glycosyltransferase [Burkholderiaceae bacterium]|jgi:processive 1,2-diacylglycerol beta-glucosyltransferase|nr:glycosyltransferase [Burkholderiaceae bacterium]
MKKFLLLSVSAGAGHVRAAEAIQAFAAIHPSGVQVEHLDVMELVPASFRKLYADLYIKLSSDHPALWGYVYRTVNEGPPRATGLRLLRAIERLNCHALLSEIRRQRPDVIICTHFLPAELLSREIRKRRPMAPVWVQVTDYHLRNRWIVPHMRGYFVATEEMAWRARAQGIAADAVCVSGIPVMPAFGDKALDRRACASRFGLDPARKIFLLMSGGAGLRGLDSLTARLLAMPEDFQLVVLAGRNRAMLEALQNLAQQHPRRLFAQGYTDQVECLMACADLVITKPGGLTVAEALATGLPMIALARVPGLEERNADFLLEQGVALKAVDMDTLTYRIQTLLTAPERLAAMRCKSAALGRPQAGRAVLDCILKSLPAHAAQTAIKMKTKTDVKTTGAEVEMKAKAA